MRFSGRILLFLCTLILLGTSCSSASKSEAAQSSYEPAVRSESELASSSHLYPAHPLIILDAGHGGTDEGARVNSFMEKRITLSTALLTKKRLEERGYKVILTRARDSYISLARRVSIANRTKCAAFVSIHFNASRSHTAKGIEIYFCDTKEKWRGRASRRLADCILYQVIDQTEAHSRGVKGGNFHVIRETEMPAVLVEGGFVTNGEERQLLKDKAYLSKIAEGIANGVDKYFKS